MRTLYLERSTGDCRDGNWVEALDLSDVGRIVVGTGPGSFAGIRSAIAFAQGYALGTTCEVLGLPSACAIAAQVYARETTSAIPLAVVGDSRRGMAWVALFDGHVPTREIFQVKQEELVGAIPVACRVVTPDAARIGALLDAQFGTRYLGGVTPTAEGLERFATANPSLLKPEPLPVYLNPAVR